MCLKGTFLIEPYTTFKGDLIREPYSTLKADLSISNPLVPLDLTLLENPLQGSPRRSRQVRGDVPLADFIYLDAAHEMGETLLPDSEDPETPNPLKLRNRL